MTITPEKQEPAPRGRPQLHGDDEVLEAALGAFAVAGFEAMSIRSLSRDLGLSHGALNQRFGSKERLFYAAVDHGFGGLWAAAGEHLQAWGAPKDETEVLRFGIRSFLMASAERPQLVRLMNAEGITASERLDYIFANFIEPTVEPLRQAVLRSRPTDRARVTTRELFFLVAHGAAGVFTLQALSDKFDAMDGTLDPVAYVDHITEVLLRTLGD